MAAPTEQQVLNLIAGFYDAAQDGALWPQVMRRFSETVEAAGPAPGRGHGRSPDALLRPAHPLQRRLMVHLERALAISRRLGHLALRFTAAREVLDRLHTAVAVLDSHARVMLVNRAAEGILAARDGLRLAGTRLHAAARPDAERLSALVRSAIDAATGRAPGAGGRLALTRPSRRRPYALLVTPLPRKELLFLPERPAAMVFITDPEHRHEPPPDALMRLHGLTRRQAELAVVLAAGHSLEETAAALGISTATARVHLRQVFAKTDTHRQAELVKLLIGLPVLPAPGAAAEILTLGAPPGR